MARRGLYIALPLMLLTGLVLGQLLSMSSQPVKMVTTSTSLSDSTAPVAESFYDAVNQFFATGDSSGLSSVLASEYRGHVDYQSESETAQEFIHHLGTLRQTFPLLQMHIVELLEQTDTVAVELTLTGAKGSFGDISLEAGREGVSYEFLRVEGGKVAERWSNSLLLPVIQFVANACLPIGALEGSEVWFERWTFAGGGGSTFEEELPYLLVGESGAVVIQADSAGENEWSRLSPVDEQTNVNGGIVDVTSMLVPGRARIRLWNKTEVASTVIQIAVRPAWSVPASRQTTGANAVFDRVAIVIQGGIVTPEQNGDYLISVGLVELSPGVSIPSHEVSGSEYVSIVSGSIGVAVLGEPAVWYQGYGRLAAVLNNQIVQAGEGIRGNPGTWMEYRTVGEAPAVFWLVTIEESNLATPVPSPESLVLAHPSLETTGNAGALCSGASRVR